MCSGCDTDGWVHGTHEETEGTTTSLTSWPMLLMYGVISAVLAVALYIDITVFVQGHFGRRKGEICAAENCSTSIHERRSWYALYLLGYVDADGTPVPWCRAICIDRFQDLCCCRQRAEFAKFTSLLLLTLGVSALFGEGERSEYNCYFDGTKDEQVTYSEYIDETYEHDMEQTYQKLFFNSFYGLKHHSKGGTPSAIGYENADLVAPGFIVAEMLAAAYQFSVDLLTHALSEADYMKRGHCLLMMNIFSLTFCVGALVYEWEGLSAELLAQSWIVGCILILLIVGPSVSTISFLLGKALVVTGCLSLSDQQSAMPEGEEESVTEEEGPPANEDDVEEAISGTTPDHVVVTVTTMTEPDGTMTKTTTTKRVVVAGQPM